MAINIKFDLVGNPEPPTILLANRNGNILGQLYIDNDSVNLSDKFNDASEFTFTLNKYADDDLTNLWDKVVNFKLVYCKEWDEWFEITVELDEASETIKTVFCKQLEKAELSQLNLYGLHINEEGDINWSKDKEVYKSTILYDENDHSVSLLHRLLKDKAPHYSIAHVDSTIANEQRTFSFDKISIDDAFQEIAEEIGCLFIYHSYLDEDGILRRTISVYDLQQNCNDCGYRGEFTDECPKCKRTNIKYGYGDDTLIFVTSDELASSGIQLTTDTDSVKNCFKLEAGDDLMTATVRNCNPNGTDYIIYISNDTKEDMSKELVDELESYDVLYQKYYNNYVSNVDEVLLNKYNALVDKYSIYNEDLQKIEAPIKGYYSLMNAYYNTIDLSLYLQSGLMPSVEMPSDSICLDCGNEGVFKDTCPQCNSINILSGAKYQANLLKTSFIPTIAIADVTITSLESVNNAAVAMAKTIINPTYKIQVNDSELIKEGNSIRWSGSFILTNYSDEEDVATTDIISVDVSDDLETFIKQKIEKALNKENADDYSITGLFKKELIVIDKEIIRLNLAIEILESQILIDPYNENLLSQKSELDKKLAELILLNENGAKFAGEFYEELKKYALNPLANFHDACQACIDILIEQGVGNGTTWSDDEIGSDGNLYEKLYIPYYDKLQAIEFEMKVREDEIGVMFGVYDLEGNLVSDNEGLCANIEKFQTEIKDVLNFEKCLGEKLWLEFCAYRREDVYSNENYTSDGLNNAELFDMALKFFEIAEKEIYKSAELQHSISTSLNNLLAIPKFQSLVKYFKVGNWIRVQVDDRIFKLRLLEYEIDFGSFDSISVEFSDVTKIKNGITDMQSVVRQSNSMATSFSSVKRQANQGEKSSAVLNDWIDNGLNATNTKIVSANSQNQIWDEHGMLFRQYDPVTGKYGDEQLKIINSTIAITNDNWQTTKTAIGKYYYEDPITGKQTMAYGINGETIVGKLLIGEDLILSNSGNNLEFGEDGLIVKNDINTVSINPNDEVSIFNIKNKDSNIFSFDDKGNLVIIGNVTALDGSDINANTISGIADVALSGEYDALKNKPDLGSYITKDVDNLTNYYKKTETDNLLQSKVDSKDLSDVAFSGEYDALKNKPDLKLVATTGSYSDLVDIEELKNWVLEQIQLSTN